MSAKTANFSCIYLDLNTCRWRSFETEPRIRLIWFKVHQKKRVKKKIKKGIIFLLTHFFPSDCTKNQCEFRHYWRQVVKIVLKVINKQEADMCCVNENQSLSISLSRKSDYVLNHLVSTRFFFCVGSFNLDSGH